MACDIASVVLQIKRIVYSFIRFGYKSACDYPIVLGIGILLLLVHRLCPFLFAYLLSSSPVFLLTALLLGALLSYGEPNVPEIEEVSTNQQVVSLKSNISITDCSMKKVENVTVETYIEKRTGTEEVYVEKRALVESLHDSNSKEESLSSITDDTLLGAEINATVETKDHVEEISKKVELQEVESVKPRNDNAAKVHQPYRFGEFMSSCWQPVIRQDDHYSDSESDLTDSSSPGASMTDIIPMLEELHTLVDLETVHPCTTTRENASSDDDQDDDDNKDEDDDHSSKEDESMGSRKENGESVIVTPTGENQEDVMDFNSLELEKNSKLESLVVRQQSKNILKFELDKNLMDMRTADAMKKMEEVSRFHVRVPSISTLRQNPFDSSNDSEETIELRRVPESAPSVLLSKRNVFDFPLDQIVGHASQSQETWSPRSYFPATQGRKHGNFYGWGSTNLQDHNGIELERGEISGQDDHDSHSDSDTEQNENNTMLMGSLEAHLGEKIKVLSAVVSDVGVLEVNSGMDECMKNADPHPDANSFPIQKSTSSTSEAKDLVHAGVQQSIVSPPSQVTDSELHVVEASPIEEINSFFKCLKEEVLVQSISEASIDYPSTVKVEVASSKLLSPDSRMHLIEATSVEEMNKVFQQLNEESNTQSGFTFGTLPIINHGPELLVDDSGVHIVETSSVEEIKSLFKQVHEEAQVHSLSQSSEMCIIEARSVEELNSHFTQLNEEAQTYAASESTCHIESTQDGSSEAILAGNEQTSELLIQDMSMELLTAGYQQTSHTSELQVIEARSIEDINSFIKQHHEEVQELASLEPLVQSSEMSANVPLSSNSAQPGHNSELHFLETSSAKEITSVLKKLHGEEVIHNVPDPNIELRHRSSEPMSTDIKELLCGSELHVVEASSLEGITTLFKQLDEELQMHAVSDSTLHQPNVVNLEGKSNESLNRNAELPVLEASSVEEMNSLFKQLQEHVQVQTPNSSELKAGQEIGTASDILVLEAKSIEAINSAFRELSHDHSKTSHDGEMELGQKELNSGLQVVVTKSQDDDGDTFDCVSEVIRVQRFI